MTETREERHKRNVAIEKAYERFWLTFTPVWFDLMQWLVVTGGLQYLGKRYHSISIQILAALSGALLWQWIFAISGKTDIAWLQAPQLRFLGSTLVSLLLLLALNVIVGAATVEIGSHGTSGDMSPTPTRTPTVAPSFKRLPSR